MTAEKGSDAMALGSGFRIDWLEDSVARNEREEIERAVALAASSVLRSARFARTLVERAGQDLEVRVWLETGFDPLQVSVWWEPRMARFWFPVVDPGDGARLGLVVFDRVPSVGAADLARDEAAFAGALADRVPVGTRIPVSDVRTAVADALVDPGVDR